MARLPSRRVYELASFIRDKVFAPIGLAMTLPLMAAAALGMWISLNSNPFFRQVRVGQYGKAFKVLKIRTLRPGAPGVMRKQEAEAMASGLGRLLRRYKIDEFPQFWNVLTGDLALVGPRPIPPDEYRDKSHYQRLAVRPGVTGLWQLSRVREEPFDRNPEYDLFYLANRSLSFDLWLIWRTVLLILFGRETKIRLAARLWERDTSWRELVPERAKAIGGRSGPLRSRVWAVVLAGVFAVGGLSSLAMGLLARGDLVRAQQSLLQARSSVRTLDVAGVRSALDEASVSFARAEGRIDSWITLPGRALPVVRGNLLAASGLIDAGQELVGAGREGLPLLETLPIEGGRVVPPWEDGALDLSPFRDAEGPARKMGVRLGRATRLLESADSLVLLPQLRDARKRALELLGEARREVEVASGVAVLLPDLLGAGGSRRWILGAENPAESRGRGGYMGSIGVIEVSEGKMSLGDFGPTADLPALTVAGELPAEYKAQYRPLGALAAWQNLTMSPSFPNGAGVFLASLRKSGGPDATGLIGMDPVALSYLMEVTGPVKVAGLAEPLSASNVVSWSLNRAYFEFEDDNTERKEVLGDVARSVWERIVSGEGIDARRLAEAVGRAFAGRHLVIYSSVASEQELIERLGIGGSVSSAPGDYLMVLAQNFGENKMDYYVARAISYRSRLSADGSIDSTVEIKVTNTAPADVSTLPSYIAGPREHLELKAGEARSYLSVLVPSGARLVGFELDGRSSNDFDNRLEVGRRAISVYLDIAPQETRTVSLRYLSTGVLVDGRYRLVVQRQATVIPDELVIDVKVPVSAEVGARDGFLRGNSLDWKGALMQDMDMSAEVSVPAWSRFTAWLSSKLRAPVAELGS